VDPQAPKLPLVYLSPPTSPESITTTPEFEGARNGVNGNDYRHGHYHHFSPGVPPVPPIPESSKMSMMQSAGARANRHSVQSTAASMSPRMRRRRRDPTPFNILVIGFLGSGKTSFIRFLKDSLGDSKRIRNVSHMSNEEAAEQTVHEDLTQPPQKTRGFERHYVEKEVDGERIGLTIFDSEGFGPREQNVVDIQLSLLINFITGKFEETFAEACP
jgi:Septin